MIRKPWGGLCAVILLVGLIPQAGSSAAESLPEPTPPVRLLAVERVETPEGASLQVRASGPFTFTSYQPHERNVIVDLTGVVSEPEGLAPATGIVWMAGYRLLPFRNARGRSVLRLDVNLEQDCALEVSQPSLTTLTLVCPGSTAASPSSPDSVSAPGQVAPATLPAAAEQPAESRQPAEPVRVRRIIVREEDGQVAIDVKATGRLGYETLTLSNPTRLVVDLPHSILISRRRQFPVDAPVIRGVRVAQFKAQPPITRLVVDLQAMVAYDILPKPDGLRLTLRNAPAAARQPAPVVEPAEVAAPPTESTAAQAEPVLLASLAPAIPASLPPTVQQPTEAPAVAAAEPVELARNATPSPPAPAPLPVMEPPAAVQAQEVAPEAAEAPRRYTGEPISINLKDVDLKDFFRLIHEISGLNIVLDPNVSGEVTVVLIDVPWDQALDIVLKNNGLGSTLEGNVLRIATIDTMKREQEELRDLARARAETVEAVTATRQLSYARASDLEPTLRRFLSSRGELIRDDRTNTLIIRDIPSVIPAMDGLIQQLDRKSLQVEIEARVVSASRAFAREIGSQLATSFSDNRGRNIFGGALGPSSLNQGSADTSIPIPPRVPAPPLIAAGGDEGTQPLASDLAAAATSGFLFGHRSPNFALDVILTAAESRNIAKILSKPRLITQNNVQAEVKQGTRIPVQTVVNNTISTQFIDVVLRLNVTPQITAEGTVFLNIVIENTSIDPGVARINGIPALATQSTTTQVLVADGSTIVIGGVMTTNNATTIDQVPLLGSIPVIGHLFKRTKVDTSTQELLFFITPRILS
ncbi:MAG: type IV pilus secretin PilQ [Terriglobia bacterium]